MSQPYHTYHDLLVVLGPTATGKTQLAVQLAYKLEGEIISADSRQVYHSMDIGTGKDLKEYKLNGKKIPYHLIDIINPQKEYNVYQFQQDFQDTCLKIHKRQKTPILCGGTGFYIKAVLMDFHLPIAKPDSELRQELETWELDDLIQELKNISPGISAKTPMDTKRRVIRAIEVEMNTRKGKGFREEKNNKIQNPIVLGIEYPREVIRRRITKRLYERLNQGMIEEVESLLNNGIIHERLESFGLEYRFISQFLQGKFSWNEMVEKLNTAIHQFAKKQMTFFRHMERSGINIHWIPKGNLKSALDLIKLN